MLRMITVISAFAIACGGAAMAETFEVQMLNRGEAGTMVFEPSALRIAAGDTVRFIATDRGHNAASVEGMMPATAMAFEGKVNEEIEIAFTEAGFYGVKCNPHFAMGMVMVIAVGDDPAAPDDFLVGRLPKKAKERFADALGGL